MQNVIAKLELICFKPSGEKFPVTIELGKPYWIRDGKGADYARCPLALNGLEKEHDVAGEDAFQALALALAYVRQALHHVVQDGGRVTIDGHDFPFEAYFPNGRT